MFFWYFPGGPVVKNPPSNAGDLGLIPFRATNIPRAIVKKAKKKSFLPSHPGGKAGGMLARDSALGSLSTPHPPTARPAPAVAASHLCAQPRSWLLQVIFSSHSCVSVPSSLISILDSSRLSISSILQSAARWFFFINADIIFLLFFYSKASNSLPFFLGYCSQGCSWPALDRNFKPHFSALLYTVAPSELLKISVVHALFLLRSFLGPKGAPGFLLSSASLQCGARQAFLAPIISSFVSSAPTS